MSPTPNDKTALWFVSVLVAGVGANWIASWTQSSPWLYLMFALVGLLIGLTMPGGFFSRDRYGPTLLGRLVFLLVLLTYLVLSPYLASSGQLALTIAGASFLWLAATLLAWRSLRSQVPAVVVAYSVALLLVDVALLLGGVAELRGGNTLVGVEQLHLGVLVLAFAYAGLSGGAAPGGVVDLRGGNTLVGGAFLVVGGAFLVLGVASLLLGDTLFGVAILLVGGSFLAVGVGVLRGGRDPRPLPINKWRERLTRRDTK